MITKTKEQISLLPSPPPKNALHEVAKLIRDFTLRMQIEGFLDNATQPIRVLCEKFRAAVRGAVPEFEPFVKEQSDKEENLSKKLIYIDEVYRQMGK